MDRPMRYMSTTAISEEVSGRRGRIADHTVQCDVVQARTFDDDVGRQQTLEPHKDLEPWAKHDVSVSVTGQAHADANSELICREARKVEMLNGESC